MTAVRTHLRRKLARLLADPPGRYPSVSWLDLVLLAKCALRERGEPFGPSLLPRLASETALHGLITRSVS